MNSDANTADPFPADRQIENLTEKPSGRVIAWPCYQPCLLVVMAMIAGIGGDRLLDVDAKITLSMAAVLWVIGIAIAFKFRNSPRVKSTKMASWLLLIAIGLGGSSWHHQCWNWIRSNHIAAFSNSKAAPVAVQVELSSEPKFQAARGNGFSSESNEVPVHTRFLAEVLKVRDGLDWRVASGKTELVIHDQVNHLRSGDRVQVFGKLVRISAPTNPGQFDFQQFYRSRGLHTFLHVYDKRSVKLELQAEKRQSSWVSSLRARLNELTWEFVGDTEAPFASAIMLGNREQLSHERRDTFLKTGTVHILAISGLHVGILAGVFFFLFRLGFANRKACLVATIVFVCLYATLVEFRPPATRAAILVSLFCLGKLIGEKGFSFNLLAAAGVIVLMLNPTDLFQLGPQLSFLAVATLTFGKDWIFWKPPQDPIKRLIARTRSWPVRAVNSLGRQVRTAFLVSGLIWVVAMPLVALKFHLVAPIALAINPLLLIPIAWGLYGGLGVLVFGATLPFVARFFGWICDRNLSLVEWMVGVAQTVPGSHLWTAGPPRFSVVVFYLGVWIFAIFPPTKLKGKWLIGLLLGWLVFGWWLPDHCTKSPVNVENRSLICTFVDVGHGTSVLIQTPCGKSILYDAGSFAEEDFGARNIAGVLWESRIEQLDAVVISHADVDHFNSLATLSEQFAIDSVFFTRQMLASESDEVRNLIRTLESRMIPIRTIAAGEGIQVSNQVKLEVLWPTENHAGENDNSESVVLSVEYAGRKILLPGDLEKSGMDHLVGTDRRDFDLVMAPHHGSPHSHPDVFLGWATPEHVVLSCGRQKVSPAAVAIYASAAKVYRTDLDGAVRVEVTSDGALSFDCWNDKNW